MRGRQPAAPARAAGLRIASARTARERAVGLLFAGLLLAALVPGCQRAFLPPIPADWEAGSASPESTPTERREAVEGHSAHAGEEAALALLRTLEEALAQGETEVVFRGLSSETRLLLDRWHPDGAEAALESRRVRWERRWWNLALDTWLLGEGPVASLRPLGSTESTTIGPRRVEFMHPDSDRVLVVIREGDEWRVHRTTISVDYLSEVEP